MIPIEDEGVDAMVGGGIDFFGHDLRIGFVLVSPERDLGLLVAGKPRLGRFEQFPFAPALALGLLVARIIRVVLAEVITGHGHLRVGTGGSGHGCAQADAEQGG